MKRRTNTQKPQNQTLILCIDGADDLQEK